MLNEKMSVLEMTEKILDYMNSPRGIGSSLEARTTYKPRVEKAIKEMMKSFPNDYIEKLNKMYSD